MHLMVPNSLGDQQIATKQIVTISKVPIAMPQPSASPKYSLRYNHLFIKMFTLTDFYRGTCYFVLQLLRSNVHGG